MIALSSEERARLLRVARRAVEARLLGEPLPAESVDGALAQPGGAFVTLRRGEELRGCIGYIEPTHSLVDAVTRAAAAAAAEDGRFDSVTLDELPHLALEISVLGPILPIAPERIEVGIHGVIIRYQGRSGLLLPQVATEQGWDRETFLDQTCVKAGVPRGAWRLPGAEILAFTARVFGEPTEET